MWNQYYTVENIDEAIKLLSTHGENARLIAGGTDLMLELERGQRKGVNVLIDISRIAGLNSIEIGNDGWIHIGPLVTHNQCATSSILRQYGFPLVQAAWSVGSPQIRNRGTIAGNLVTASPANDTIPPLMALGAEVILRSLSGERTVALSDFYLGVRKTVLMPGEILTEIKFPPMTVNQRGIFTKFALRQAQAISVVNLAIILTMEGEEIKNSSITLGAVAPKIIFAREAMDFLNGKRLEKEVIWQAAELTMSASRPISDIRGSANYRKMILRVITQRALSQLATSTPYHFVPTTPVTLATTDESKIQFPARKYHDLSTSIQTVINGKPYQLLVANNKTLLQLIREEARLIGTKEGCDEGECGACTVLLDGVAVMACLVPAPRAECAEIITVEGLAKDGNLSNVQKAFIETGAVQCGYCTPGFLMSATKLLEERPQPSQGEIIQALTGNLCRCTGYYKIVEAIEMAAREV